MDQPKIERMLRLMKMLASNKNYLIYFSEEEACILNGLIDSLDATNALKINLKKTLSAVYNSTSVAFPISVNFPFYEKFRDALWKGKNLINYEDKNDTTKYSYDFNTIVQFQCANLEIDNIVKDIPNSKCIK